MKKQLIGVGIATLMCVGVVSANASLWDLQDGTIFDDVSKLYWQQDVSLWIEMTYDEQISDINENFIGSHMATSAEISSLWLNSASDIFETFYPTVEGQYDEWIIGRYNTPTDASVADSHFVGEGYHFKPNEALYLNPLGTSSILDDTSDSAYGAWVVTAGSSVPVPEPSTLLIVGTGLAGLVGTRIRKKKK